jgi:hypothetical protein
MKESIGHGYGVDVESNLEITSGNPRTYFVTLTQDSDEHPPMSVMLSEDELMKVVEFVCEERPNFARGVARVYFRQQKAKRKVAA